MEIGVSRGWVHNVVLLERGEERLVSAAETGLILIAVAAEIAMAKEEQVQSILVDAYESGKIKGKKGLRDPPLARPARWGRKRVKDSRLGQKNTSRRPSADELLRVYQREEKQRLLARKAEFAQARLLFIVRQ